MQLVARPCIAAAAALVTGSVIAATPVASPALPEVHMPAIHLTATAVDGLSQEIADAMSSFNAQLSGQELGLNGNLYNGEIGWEKAIAPFFASVKDSTSPDSILNGVVNRLFNVNNLFLGTGENTFNSLLGANITPHDILATLLTGYGGPNVFDAGNIGGLEGIFDQSLITFGDGIGLANDQFGLSLPGPTIDQLNGLQAQELALNTNLVNGETAFNTGLVGNEVNFEQMLFGSDSALNGVVNRLFNVGNLFLGTGENTFNSLLGANFDPGQIVQSLLTGAGNPANPFDTGGIGGLEGIFGQGYMAFADSLGLLGNPAGLLPTDLLGAFNPADLLGAFNPADLAGILNPLDVLGAFNPLDVLSMLPF